MRNQHDRCWRTEWVNREHCWTVGWGEETATITRAGGQVEKLGSSQLEAQGAGTQTLEERALPCWCWHLSASAMRLLPGVWSETGTWNTLLPTGTRRSESLAQPCRCPLDPPPQPLHWCNRDLNGTGEEHLQSQLNPASQSWVQVDGCVAARQEGNRSTYFRKCPHFCILSGPFPWDNGSISYFFRI